MENYDTLLLIKEGYVYKKGKYGKWSKKYLKIKDHELNWYSNNQDITPKHSIRFKYILQCEPQLFNNEFKIMVLICLINLKL